VYVVLVERESFVGDWRNVCVCVGGYQFFIFFFNFLIAQVFPLCGIEIFWCVAMEHFFLFFSRVIFPVEPRENSLTGVALDINK